MNTRNLLFTDCVDFVGSACQPFAGTKEYISTGAVETDHINDDAIEIVDYSSKPSRANLEVAAGDILFAKMQGTKKTLSIDSSLAKHIYSTGFCAVRAKEGVITSRCLYHLLTSKTFLAQKDKHCSGATQKAITNDGLNEIAVKIPPIEKQAIIAAQLDSTVGIIAKRQQQLQKLDDLIKARFVEMFGEPITNPNNWPQITLQDSLAKGRTVSYGIVQTGDDYEGGIPVFRPVDITGGHIPTRNELKRTDPKISELYKRTKLNGNELLITVRGSIGETFQITDEFMGCNVGRNIVPLVTDSSKIEQRFLQELFAQHSSKKWLASITKGIALQGLNMGEFKHLPVIAPPLEMQKTFVLFATQTDKTKSLVQRSLAQAQTLFAALMQEHFG